MSNAKWKIVPVRLPGESDADYVASIDAATWPVWYGQEDDAIYAARKVIDAGALR